MSKHRSIYGPYAGRFQSLEHHSLWEYFDDADGDQPEREPIYYGQTRRLAEETGGSIIDLAGGCVGVVVREDSNGIVCIALDDACETLTVWSEDHEGELLGETISVPFRPYEDGVSR